MHIPDGYLSPETCLTLYAASTPFWYLSLRRVKKVLSTQLLPLISIFAAFSFVIMMFNLPLPGGTTGHAVGMGIAAIVLGPWASILAISIALVIQALLFGDGGITAIGANCFNMAIVGSLATYVSYRVLARHAGLCSRRRIVAAAIAGYAGINLSALCAAFEFGIQPALFHDAAGTPLYCPYPLSISIPAMMIGHLTFAGLAELVITAGVMAYLQKADPALLRRTASDAPDRDLPILQAPSNRAFPTLRRLWWGLALLLVLTPLGILAAGSAWGEWTARDFADPAMRLQIGAASGNQIPANPPQGLERLSSFWTAPLSRYAPAIIHSEKFGYFVSAALGVGVIIIVFLLLQLVLPKTTTHDARGPGFIDGTLRSLFDQFEYSRSAETIARTPGFLQRLDPRVKVVGIFSVIVSSAMVHRLSIVCALFGISVLTAVASSVPLSTLFRKIWLPALSFSGLIALPAIFVTPGSPLFQLPLLHWDITRQGLLSAALLIFRVETAATFSCLLILTTEWVRMLRALRFFRVPVTAVVILGMTHRYLFLLMRTAQEMFEARRSRLVGTLEAVESRRLAGATVGVLLSKSFQLSSEVYSAMRSRGFQGEVYLLDDLAIQPRDWLQLGGFLAVALVAILLGRA